MSRIRDHLIAHGIIVPRTRPGEATVEGPWLLARPYIAMDARGRAAASTLDWDRSTWARQADPRRNPPPPLEWSDPMLGRLVA